MTMCKTHALGRTRVRRVICAVLMLVLLFCTLTGCKPKKVDEALVGTWEHMLGAVGGRWTFRSDGTCSHTMYSYTDAYGTDFTYEAEDGKLIIYWIYDQQETHRYTLAYSNGKQCLLLDGEVYYKIG